MFFVKRIFAPDICLRLQSLIRFFVKSGPGSHSRLRNFVPIWNHEEEIQDLYTVYTDQNHQDPDLDQVFIWDIFFDP